MGPRTGVLRTDYVTVKVVALLAPPPDVVTAIFPVLAPVGTVTVIDVSELMVKVAATPPIVTLVVLSRLTPVTVMVLPTAPLAGVKLLI